VPLPKLWRSSTFRQALLYIALLSASVLAVFAFIYWSTVGYMSRQTEAMIAGDLNALVERYRRDGLNALITSVNENAARDRSGYTLYALALPDGRKLLAGNLKRWPPHSGKAWVEFDIDDYIAKGYGDDGDALARIEVLAGGELLLVGRDIEELKELRELIGNALLSGLALTALLGLAGAVMLSFGPVRKIETINKTSQAIMRGDLSRRIPLTGKDDDINQLAANLNRMLDQIQSLMESVRHASNDIAHDLRTPLTRLRARLESLDEMQTDPEQQRVTVAESIAEADSLLATFNALLRIAQVEAGAAYSEFATVDLAAVVRDAADLYEPLAADKGQRLDVLTAQGIAAKVPGDRDLLFQALVNLLDNAIKYTPASA
jgi:signal transduction histidine kinase